MPIDTVIISGFKLDTKVLMIKVVSDKLACVMECYKEACCRSINYKKTSTFQNEPNCEILHNVVHNSSENALMKTSSFDYVYLVDPEKEYNASCFANDSEDNVRDPDGFGTFKVWCDMQDGGGWTLFQRRQDGSVDFYRGWSDYKVGFGHLTGEFWLGLDKIHRLTTSSTQSILRIDMWDFARTHAYAEYKNFSVASESDSYKLNIGNFSGNAGDSFSNLNGMMFTTNDRDNDLKLDQNCATKRQSAWWNKRCGYSNLNGLYFATSNVTAQGIIWYHWKNDWKTMKNVEMKIRLS
ncbi:Hypothetical predicted protein [Paramuricea clavata]|uniref:Uncharacterized protein n=1 Tax=Paramuricea clavata TaxID=317549 RepID=A0A6S7HL26_PARCT|nr:Hypothetical predicted protein [Paramuricea clavata]